MSDSFDSHPLPNVACASSPSSPLLLPSISTSSFCCSRSTAPSHVPFSLEMPLMSSLISPASSSPPVLPSSIIHECDPLLFENGGWENAWIDDYLLFKHSLITSPDFGEKLLLVDEETTDVPTSSVDREEEISEISGNAYQNREIASKLRKTKLSFMQIKESLCSCSSTFLFNFLPGRKNQCMEKSNVDLQSKNNDKSYHQQRKLTKEEGNCFKCFSLDCLKKLDQDQPQENIMSERKKYFLLFLYFWFIALTGAAIFNWADLRVLLVRNGAYSEECDPEELKEKGECLQQLTDLNNSFNITIVFIKIAGIFLGITFDIAGAKFTAILGQVLFASGILCLSFNKILIGLILLGSSMNPIFNSTVSIANLFAKNKSLIICSFSAAGDLCIIDFLILRLLSDTFINKIKAKIFLLSYLGVVGFLIVIAVIYFPKKSFKENQKKHSLLSVKTEEVFECEYERSLIEEEQKRKQENRKEKGIMKKLKRIKFNIKKGIRKEKNNKADVYSFMKTNKADNNNNAENLKENNSDISNNTLYTITEVQGVYSPIKRDLKHFSRFQCLKTLQYWIFLPFFVLLYFKKINYMRDVDNFLKEITDSQETVNFYLTAYSVTLCFGSVTSILLGLCADKIGIISILFIVNGLSCLFSATSLIPFIGFQILTFMCFTIYKSFVLSSIFCYIAETFGFKNIGFLTSLQQLIAGAFCLLNIPFQSYVIRRQWWLNHLILLLSSILMFSVPIFLFLSSKREKKAAFDFNEKAFMRSKHENIVTKEEIKLDYIEK